LYKISVDADKPEEKDSESVSAEDSIPVVEETVEIDEGVVIAVDDFEAPVVEKVVFEPVADPTAVIEPVADPTAVIEPVADPTVVIELPAPIIVEENPVVEPEQSEATVEAVEVPETLEVEEEEPVATIEYAEPTEIIVETAEVNDSEEIIEVEEPENEEAVEEEIVMEEELVMENEYAFEPEPITREVMENLAKNVSLKIKLADLLLKGEVKMTTFERLFESYVARGELLLNSRNEMLERVRFDLDSRERALNEAKIGLEELGVRRSIGDVSEEEYRAKSPGFEWDIGQYKDDVDYKRAEIEYLEDPTRLMTSKELEELREKGEEGHRTIDTLVDSSVISSEMSERIKRILEESLACLKT
jgi:nicotinate-nucleotide--dimethylbenzimidazole phosphoribosyltransferase